MLAAPMAKTVGSFEGMKTIPVDCSLGLFLGVGPMSTVRNLLAGLVTKKAKTHAKR